MSQNNCNFAPNYSDIDVREMVSRPAFVMILTLQIMNTRFIYFFLLTFALVAGISACSDEKTYGELRDAEKKAVESFIKKGCVVYAEDGVTKMLEVLPIKTISEEEFYANDSTTDVSKNEYVLFAGSGVYMQIVRKGSGEKIQPRENCRVACRFFEYNIGIDSLIRTNRISSQAHNTDIMNVSNNGGTFTASFSQGVMYSSYGQAVPGGWLMPLPFINLGRWESEDVDIAKVRLIVPSTEGTSTASSNVFPCFYEITMQRGR